MKDNSSQIGFSRNCRHHHDWEPKRANTETDPKRQLREMCQSSSPLECLTLVKQQLLLATQGSRETVIKSKNIFIFFLWSCWGWIPIITTKASKGSCLCICVRSMTEEGQKSGKRPDPGKSPKFAVLCFSSYLRLKKVIVAWSLHQPLVQLLSKCKAWLWLFKSPFWPCRRIRALSPMHTAISSRQS